MRETYRAELHANPVLREQFERERAVEEYAQMLLEKRAVEQYVKVCGLEESLLAQEIEFEEPELAQTSLTDGCAMVVRLRLVRGEMWLRDGTPLQAIECAMRHGWTFRLGQRMPQDYLQPIATSDVDGIDRCHATIFYDADTESIVIRDSSTTGVFINNARVKKAVPIELLDHPVPKWLFLHLCHERL